MPELYRHLADRGWVAPPRAAALLRLQSAVLDARYEQVLVEQARCR